MPGGRTGAVRGGAPRLPAGAARVLQKLAVSGWIDVWRAPPVLAVASGEP
jgi:hypothetical protein